jgi:hypothetical protein
MSWRRLINKSNYVLIIAIALSAKHFVGQMLVGQMSVGQMVFDQTAWNHTWLNGSSNSIRCLWSYVRRAGAKLAKKVLSLFAQDSGYVIDKGSFTLAILQCDFELRFI